MNEYVKQANDFLTKANATCKIEFGGVSRNKNWKEKEKRNWYDVTITTPNGTMNFVFWDSIHNTEISMMTLKQYVEKKLRSILIKSTTVLQYKKAIRSYLKKSIVA